jgi:hypothetical protein
VLPFVRQKKELPGLFFYQQKIVILQKLFTLSGLKIRHIASSQRGMTFALDKNDR